MEIQLFNNPQFGDIRMSADDNGNPLFCATDVAKALGYTNPYKAVIDHCKPDGLTIREVIDSVGRTQQAKFIKEGNLYRLIARSNLPEAEKFESWIFDEVVPAIRKTGGYIPVAPEETPQETLSKAFLIATETLKQRDQRIQMLIGQNKMLEQENATLAPKAQYADEVLQANDGYTFEQMAKQLNFRSVHKLTKALIDKKICYKRSNTYMLYAEYAEQGYTKPRTSRFFHRDGTPGSNTYTVWTEKGRMFLHELFNVALQPVDLTMFNL